MAKEYIDMLIDQEEEVQENKHRVVTGNGTPFSDEAWKAWFGHKSNKERFIEAEENLEQRAD